MNIPDKYAFWRWPRKIRELSSELEALKVEHAKVVTGQAKLLEWVKVTHRLQSPAEGIRALLQSGKRLVALVLMLFVSQFLLAQPAPPIIRNPMTTNGHFGPTPTEGQVPIWNAIANKWSNNIISGASTPHVWTNDNGTLRPIDFPTNIMFRVVVPDDGIGTNFYFDSRVFRTNAQSKLFQIYNGGSNALTIGQNGQLMVGRGNTTPFPGAVLYGIFDQARGETNQQEVFIMSQNSTVGYNGAADLIVDTNYGALLLFANKEGGTKFARFGVQVGAGADPENFNSFTMQALVDGATYFQVDPNFTLLTPTNYLFSSSVRITNTHTLMSLQNSNFPVLEVDGVGDLRLIKKVPYLWPSAQGAAGTALTNNGSGGLGWWPISVGGGSVNFADVPWTNNSGNRIHPVVDEGRISFYTNRILGRLIRADGTNTALGSNAAMPGFGGELNTAVGTHALSIAGGIENSALGHRAAVSNSSGSFNTVMGSSAMEFNEFRSDNTAIGYNSLHTFSTGFQNTAIGAGTMDILTTSFDGTALGWGALDKMNGSGNTALGAQAMLNAEGGGNYNIAVGYEAFENSDRLEGNVAIGRGVLTGINDMTNAVVIGYQATTITGGLTNAVAIGALTRITTDNQMMLGTNITRYVFRNVEYEFPPTNGLAGQFLAAVDSVRVLAWSNAPSGPGGAGLTTNVNQFLGVPLSIKDEARLTNINIESSLQVSNGHTYLAGPVTNLTQLNLPHLTVSRSAIINAQGDVTNSTAESNWSLYPTNVWNDRQGGSLVLTNLAGTGAITNLFSPTLSNATIKPLVVGVGNAAGATNTTGHIRGIEAGANVTITGNGSNYVIAASASGSTLVFTNQLWLEMTGNDSTGARNDPSKPFNTLTNAIAAAIPGDVINIGVGRFTNYIQNGVVVSNGVSLSGVDWNNTVLCFTNKSMCIVPQDNTTFEHLRIEVVERLGTVTCAQFGVHESFHSFGFTNVTVRNVKMKGFTDTIIVSMTANPCQANFYDCEFESNADLIVQHGNAANKLYFQNCNFYTHDPLPPATSIRLCNMSAGLVLYDYCSLLATNGFNAINGGTNVVGFNLLGGRIRAENTTMQLYCDFGTTNAVTGIGTHRVEFFNCMIQTNNMTANVQISPPWVSGVAQGSGVTISTNTKFEVTVSANLSNIFSPTLSNATIKPLVVGVGNAAGATNSTGQIRGLEAGSNVTFSENGSNIVISATGSGGGLTTNANQFAPQVLLTIKDSAMLTNLQNIGVLNVTNPPGWAGSVRMWHTNGLSYTELMARTNDWLPTNQFIFSVTNPVAGQVLRFNSVTIADGVAAVVVTNETLTSSGGLATNANQFAASVELAIKSGALLTNTLHYPSNLTGPATIYLSSVGQGTNLNEWRGTNGAIGLSVSSNGLAAVYARLDLSNSIAFRTNFVDFKLNMYQALTNALSTNLVLQLTNTYEGVTTRFDAYGNGRLGGGRTNAWQLLCTVASGVTIYWPPGTTNGNYDVLVNSNQVVSFTFMGGLGSTNILASYRVLEGIGAN